MRYLNVLVCEKERRAASVALATAVARRRRESGRRGGGGTGAAERPKARHGRRAQRRGGRDIVMWTQQGDKELQIGEEGGVPAGGRTKSLQLTTGPRPGPAKIEMYDTVRKILHGPNRPELNESLPNPYRPVPVSC